MSKLDLSGKYLHRRTKKVFFVDTDKVLEGDADFKNRTLFEKIFNPVDGYAIISPSLYWVKKEKIAIDLTGGQVPFSLATYQSGKNLDIDIIYTKSSYDKGKLLDGTQKSILIGNKK